MALSSFYNSGPGEQAILLHPSSSDLAVESGDLDPHPHQGQPGLRFAELLLGPRGFQSNCTLSSVIPVSAEYEGGTVGKPDATRWHVPSDHHGFTYQAFFVSFARSTGGSRQGAFVSDKGQRAWL